MRVAALFLLSGCIVNEPPIEPDPIYEIHLSEPRCVMPERPPIPGCSSDEHCRQGSPCTLTSCVHGQCEYTTQPDDLPCSMGEWKGTCHDGGCCPNGSERE